MPANGPFSIDPDDLPRVKIARANAEKAKAEKARQDSIMIDFQRKREFQLDSMKQENERLRLLAKVPKADEKEVNEICDWLYDAVDGLGTDNIGFERALLKIEKNNVIEVMNKWDATYGKQYGETFIESFLNDASRRQRKVYGTRIIDCMQQRANDYGVSLSPYIDNARTELYTIGNSYKINENIEEMRRILYGTDYQSKNRIF